MTAAGLPLLPGSVEPLGDAESAAALANETGYPVIIKAAAGGGGRGMSIVEDRAEFVRAYQQTRATAAGLGELTVSGAGIRTTREFLDRVLRDPLFVEAKHDTSLVARIMAGDDRRGNRIGLGYRPGGMKAVRFGLLALVFAVAACGDPGAAGTPADSPLRGRTFLSTAVTGHQLEEKTRVRLTFTGDDRLIADAGCNSMQGSVRVDGGKIDVSELGATGIGCPQPLMEQDTWLGQFLSSKPSWKLDGDTLTVSSGSTSISLLDRKVAEPDLPLQGTKWTVSSIMDGEVVSSSPAAASAWLLFDKDTVQVSAGCNSGSGTYQVSGNTLRIGDIATTRKACEPDIMTLENAVLGVLRDQVNFEIDSDKLTLKLPSGKGLELRGQRS